MAELVDALDLGSSAARRGGSTPFTRTKNLNSTVEVFHFHNQIFIFKNKINKCIFADLIIIFKMKITQSKTKKMVAKLTVEVNESDYLNKVSDILKKYRKDAVVPGFRKGKTPMSIIEKQYKNSIVVDEVNKLLQDNLYKHITDNKIRVLGSPLPLLENEIDWVNKTEYKFE